jgi:hypothetical protein
MKFRKNYINQKLSRLLEKYNNQDYLLLKPLKFKASIGLGYNELVTIENLKIHLPQYQLIDNRLYQDSQVQSISGYKYYSIDDTNIESILKQINYNIDGFVFIE